MKQTLEQKQQEKARLAKAYSAAKRAEWARLREECPLLPALRRSMRRIADPRELLVRLADSPLRTGPLEYRYAALRLIQAHSERVQRAEGRAVLDDPLPPQRNLYLAARELFAVR